MKADDEGRPSKAFRLHTLTQLQHQHLLQRGHTAGSDRVNPRSMLAATQALLAAVLTSVLWAPVHAFGPNGTQPNILLYVIDDLGFADLSLKGAASRTGGGVVRAPCLVLLPVSQRPSPCLVVCATTT